MDRSTRAPFAMAGIGGLGLLLASCYSAPLLSPGKNPVTSLERVLAHDLSTSGFAARAHHAQSALALLAREPLRLQRATSAPRQLAAATAARLQRVPARLTGLASDEVARCPGPTTLATVAGAASLPGPSAQAIRADLTGITHRLVLSPRPLDEIDDIHHRTDPHDVAPAASLWQRFARRLRL